MSQSKIHPKNKKYIAYTIDKLSDIYFFDVLIKKVLQRAENFYNDTDKELLLKKLKDKITRGSIEHGEIPTDYEKIEGELQDEYLDIIAYNMIHLFNAGIETNTITKIEEAVNDNNDIYFILTLRRGGLSYHEEFSIDDAKDLHTKLSKILVPYLDK